MRRRIVAAILYLTAAPALAAPPAPDPPRLFLSDGRDLVYVKQRAAAGDPALTVALVVLRARADEELKAGPFTIVHKPTAPPSGDKHDYVSMAPYFWPDPSKKDGLPYIRRDGRVNPERQKYDRPLLGKMSDAVSTLGLAYSLTGEERYAEHAARLLRVWFLDAPTRMNPNLNFAQFIPGVTVGRGIGIIDTVQLLAVVDAVGMLRGSRHWAPADQAGMEAWFRDYLHWLRTSKNGKDEAAALNNHGSWYDAQVATFGLFVGERDSVRQLLEESKTRRIARQIEPDGRQPLELRRTKSFGYSAFNLRALFALATLGDRVGVDLWRFETADGRSLRKALDWLTPFATGEQKWEHEQIVPMSGASLVPLWRRAAVAYREPRYERLIDKLPDRGGPGTTDLLYPKARAPQPEGPPTPPERPPPADAAGVEFFEKRVRPLLAENCSSCHGPEKQRGGLLMTSLATILKGGDRGPAVLPGQPDESLLLRAVRYADDELRMPPKGKLREEQIADLAAWVKMGAAGPKDRPAAARPSNDFNLAERLTHWAYQPVRPTAPPAVNDSWCRSPIDAFILARLQAAGLTPAPEADRRTLIRRVTFDLLGLPPAPAEVEAFVNDPAPDAYERLVERLLASPHYGERWGRHWLDVVRYSETLGFEFDFDLYNAWRYRDYVIRAFNDDLPYDQFVIEHLAGDLLPRPRRHPTERTDESILATGFFQMGEGKQTPVDIRQEQADRLDNQIDVLGKAFLGQTVACARCHDHKFDAIPTRDYYALAGYLKSSRPQQAFLDPPDGRAAPLRQLADLRAKLRERVAAELVPAWLGEARQASRYLRAARAVTPDDQAALTKAAQESGVEPARLERWVKALRPKDPIGPDHPLHAWVQTAAGRERATVRATLHTQADRAGAVPRFADFSGPTYGDWAVTGDAFGTGPAGVDGVVVGDRPERPVARLTTGGADSGRLAARLQGELRSPTFTIDKRYVHLRLSGRSARVNLVIDGYTLLMNPMYGKLTVTAPEAPAWRTVPVDRWVGHRAYVEVSDSSIPMHGLNPPPSTARVPDGPSDGFVVLEQVAFSDDPDPPAAPNRLNLHALDRATADGPDALAAAYQELIVAALTRWQAGPTAADEVALLNWLLHNGLFDGAASPSPDLALLLAKHRAVESSLPAPRRAPALADGTGEDESVFLRGNYRTLGERAPREEWAVRSREWRAVKEWRVEREEWREKSEEGSGAPRSSLSTLYPPLSTPSPLSTSTGSGRLDLARRLVDPANPLLARVLVNRLWQHHFGEGIVRTPDDFGRMGQPPTHPELLDDLAAEFVRGGWSVKALHRRILLSSTYRQASEAPGRAAARDPENRLLHRMPVRRLEAEAIRDAILTVAGRLDRTLHGPSVLPYLTPHMEGRGRPQSGPLDGGGRRSVYLNARRNFLVPMFVAFDYPAGFTPVGRRGTTTVPAQALALMNDPFVVQQAARWAERTLAEPGQSPAERVAALYRAAFARPPTAGESHDALAFLERQARQHGAGPDDPRPWADLCHVLINVKEFIFVN